jgi:hypothetical protein
MSSKTDFDLSEALNESTDEGIPFQRFGLTRNPFPKSAVAEAERARTEKFSRCRQVSLDKLRKFIITVYKSMRWSGCIVKGEAGSGKSHTFFYASNEINRQLGDKENERALSIYIENPKDTINELFQDVMEHLGRDVLEAYIANSIIDKAMPIIENSPKQYKFGDLKGEIPIDPLSRLRHLGESMLDNFENRVLDDLVKHLAEDDLASHRDFARCICILVLNKEPEKRNSAWRFCTGKTLGKNECRDLRLVSDRLSEDEIIRYIFPSLIQILKRNQIRILYLFIDEIEKIASKTDMRRKDFLENLRSLIDNNLNNFSMIFSCQTEAWDILASTSTALSDRMSEIVDLDPLLPEQAVFLIEDYLEGVRLPNFQSEKLSPFNQQIVEKINTISKGSVRQVLQNCHIILEHAASSETIEQMIPLEFIEKILGKGTLIGSLYSYS